MLDVIDFMERMGGDAQLSQASVEELSVALAHTELTSDQRAAVLQRDAERMGKLLGKPPVCIMVAPPGPPGTGPSPMRPAIPPPAPDEDDEGEDRADHPEQGRVANGPINRREPETV